MSVPWFGGPLVEGRLLLLKTFNVLAATALYTRRFRLRPAPRRCVARGSSISVPQRCRVLSNGSIRSKPTLPLLHSLVPRRILNTSFHMCVKIGKSGVVGGCRRQVPHGSRNCFLGVRGSYVIVTNTSRQKTCCNMRALTRLLTLSGLPLTRIASCPSIPCQNIMRNFCNTP